MKINLSFHLLTHSSIFIGVYVRNQSWLRHRPCKIQMQTCCIPTRNLNRLWLRESAYGMRTDFSGCHKCWAHFRGNDHDGVRGRRGAWHFPYLFCKPAKVPDLSAPSDACFPQLLSDLGNHSGQQVTDVGMDGTEPGLGSGWVLAP